MAKRRTHSAPLLFIAVVMAMSALIPVTAQAAPTTPAPSGSGQGIEISPPVIELMADPGQSITASIRVRNVTSGDLTVHGQVDDFAAKGEDGEPNLLLNETAETRYSIKYWIPSVPTFTLKPQEVRTAQVQINLPANAEPGGHYGVVRFTGLPPDIDGSGVSLSASIGALMLLSVSGDITEKLGVAEFYAAKGTTKKSFFETGPLTLNERIKNEGSVHVKPRGYVDVYNFFGQRVQHSTISQPAHNVLPGSIRKFTQTIDKKYMFGRYTAKFNVTYGVGSKKSLQSKTISFWVIPYRLILIALAGLIIIVLLLRLAIKRYNQYIIKQARRKP